MSPKAMNVDQLREAIDRGETGEKVAFPDPAAAPLGTDAEAGGVSPTAEEVATDATQVRSSPPCGKLGRDLGVPIYLSIVAVLAVAILAIMLLVGGPPGSP